MANLTGNQIKNTYQRLLQIDRFITQDGTGSADLSALGVSGSMSVTGSLVVTEDITARSIITQLTQSTVLYRSGSTKFGDTIVDDRHEFTGSVEVTGSMDLHLDELTLDGTFRHTGSFIHSGSIDIVTTGDITQTGNYTRNGQLNQEGAIVQTGDNVINGALRQTGSLIHSGTLSIVSTGDIDLTGDITQSGNVDITGNTTQVGTLVRNGNTTITGSFSHSGSAVTEGEYEVKEGVYGAFFANPQTINKNVTIPASYNSRIFGPITVAAGKTLTVGANAKLEIIDI